MSGSNLFSISSSIGRVSDASFGIEKMAVVSQSRTGIVPIADGFAPDILERRIVKTTSVMTEIERGTFKEAESKMLEIVKSSDSILLNQNVNKNGKDKKSFFVGRYNIKVDTAKYDSVVAQLKGIGEVTSFNENQQDVTGRFENLNVELEAENAKLSRYNQLYLETKDVEFKIQLTDRIFNQERRIKYLEDSLENIDKRVEYSTISITITEEKSKYVDVAIVKFSELIKSFVGSVNLLIKLFFMIIPWIIAIYIIRFLFKIIRKH